MGSSGQLLAAALAFGAMHAFGPDHLAAVGVFVSRRPSWRRAAGLGARWGLGHSASILLVGSAVILAGLRIPDRFTSTAERFVGVVLVAIGMTALWRAWRLHAHTHTHDGSTHWHLHSHAAGPSHDHGHGALFGIGMLHGLAGTGAIVALLPASAGSRANGVLFLAAFGLGTIASMALFGAAAGHLLARSTAARAPALRAAVALAGLASVLIGVWWLASGGT